MILKAVRTDCRTGNSREVEIEVEIGPIEGLSGTWVRVVRGGSSGFEGFRLPDEEESLLNGWMACFGGTLYDQLYVPGEELRKVFPK